MRHCVFCKHISKMSPQIFSFLARKHTRPHSGHCLIPSSHIQCPAKSSHVLLQQGFLQNWSYLHDGTELRFVLHLLFCHPPLDTGQNTGFEEVPPVVMEDSEKQLK